MDFWQVIQNRKSVRKYDTSKLVSNEDVEKIIAAANRAPSAGNFRPVEFMVITDDKIKQNIFKVAREQKHVVESPVLIIVIGDIIKNTEKYGERGSNLYVIQDAAAATENILLAATALGLGSCWMGGFDEQKLAGVLQLPNNKRPLAMVPVGYELGVF